MSLMNAIPFGAIVLVPSALALGVYLLSMRHLARTSHERCRECGYKLLLEQARCPECGADRDSSNVHRPLIDLSGWITAIGPPAVITICTMTDAGIAFSEQFLDAPFSVLFDTWEWPFFVTTPVIISLHLVTTAVLFSGASEWRLRETTAAILAGALMDYVVWFRVLFVSTMSGS